MQITHKVRTIKQLLETTAEEMAKQDFTGSTCGMEFALSISYGDKSSSEIISMLKALQGAVSKFNEDDIANLQLNVAITSPQEQQFLDDVDSRMKAYMELQKNQPKLISA